MACAHRAGFKVYRRGPGPSYSFLPAGLACPKCGRFFPPEPRNNLDGGAP